MSLATSLQAGRDARGSVRPWTGLILAGPVLALATERLSALPQIWRTDYPMPVGGAAVYDPDRDRLILMPSGPQSPPFQWDGASWQPVADNAWSASRVQAPSVFILGVAAAVFDEARRQVLIASLPFSPRYWDGQALTVAGSGSLPVLDSPIAMVYDSARQRTVLFGARQPSLWAPPTPEHWEFDGVTWSQVQGIPLPPARTMHAMAFDPIRQRTVLFGGGDASTPPATLQPFNDTWEWDGTSWTQAAPAASPTGRRGHMMAFDPPSGRVILYGGQGRWATLADTWSWDGTNWTQVPGGGPGPRTHAAMAGTPSGTFMLLGWLPNVSGLLQDTWVFRNGSWTQVDSGHPPDLGNLGWSTEFAFDSIRGCIVGFMADGFSRSETWEWNGRWSFRGVAPIPVDRLQFALAFDQARGNTVMFCGDSWSGPVQETWTWDGAAWQQHNPMQSPTARYGHGMAYHAPTRRVVLFGGVSGVPPSSTRHIDTWLWDGQQWTRVFPRTTPVVTGRVRMFADEARGRIVMWGQGSPGTWEWDGNDWTLADPGPWWPRGLAACYDPMQGQVIAVAQHYRTVWTGSSWTPQTSFYVPVAGGSLHGDPVHGRLLLIQGSVTSGDPWTVHIHSPTPAQAARRGSGCGSLRLLPNGVPVPGNGSFALDIGTPQGNTPAFLVLGRDPASTPLGGGCTLLLDRLLGAIPLSTGGRGWATLRLPIPPVLGLRGTRVSVQAVALTGSGPVFGYGLSRALDVVVGN